MRRTDYRASGGERAKAALAAILVNGTLGLAFLTGLALRHEERTSDPRLETFDVTVPPPPPEAEPEPERDSPEPEPEGAAGKKAEATPVVAPPSPIPRPQPAAEKPAQGSATTSGAASAGTGPGAGGSGSGSGGGGSGGGGIGSEARLLGGNRARLPSALLRTIPQERGYAHLLLTVGPAGRVTGCDVLTSSGFGAIDQSLCAVMVQRSRWQPARDRAGQPIAVQVRYTATWSKN